MSAHLRLGQLPLDTVVPVLQAYARDPVHHPAAHVFLGESVEIASVRLQTFGAHPLCCSKPHCGLAAAYFVVERCPGPPGRSPWQSFHLNLYALNAQGEEVMLTHDHTLARGLGGEDSVANTTVMCMPCNQLKSRLESKEAARRQRAARGLPAHGPASTERAVPTPEALARADRQWQRMLAAHHLTPADYHAQCEAWAQDPAFVRRPPRPLHEALAASLGLSVDAYGCFQADLERVARLATVEPLTPIPSSPLRRPRC